MNGAFGSLLLDWYGREARALPWRATRDPYAILVSEIMLQQTQAARVVPHYRAFLARFPSVADLASAPLADVLTAWRGLGYNRRARNLHRTAIAIAEDHDGVVPSDFKALRALPGLGDYTARAVLAFAFDQRAAPVDVNIGRVLARAVSGAPLTRASAQRLAEGLVPPETPGAWSHALMDLGARVCTARQPRCATCPVAPACIWKGEGSDPAAASALRSRPQSAFTSSDRYHRGRLVDAMRTAPVSRADLAAAAHLDDPSRPEGPSVSRDPSRLERVVAAVIADGLAEWHADMLRLPGGRGER